MDTTKEQIFLDFPAERHVKLELLHDVVVTSRLAAAHLLRAALEEVAAALQSDYAALVRNDGSQARVEALYERTDDGPWQEARIAETFPALPFSNVQRTSSFDVLEDRSLAAHPLLRRLGTRSLVVWPLLAHGRTWHCCFGSRMPRANVVADVDMNLIEGFATIVCRLIELREEQRVQAEHVTTDPLTGLLTRAATLSRAGDAIAAAERNHTRVALLYLDVDRFKWINDTYGHSLGDSVLQEIGARLKLSLRPYDVAGRIGGDEFSIVISDFASDDELAEIALRLIESISQPLQVDGYDVSVSATVGVAIFPNDSSSVDDLIRHADTAMYAAKREGGVAFSFYSASAEERVKSRRVISDGLRSDRMDREFILCLQPIVDARTGLVTRAEVLTRWMHPEMGLLAPAKYIEIARDSRLSSKLDGWVLRKAMQTALDLDARGESVILHVNVAEPADLVLDTALEFDRHEAAAEFIAIELNERLFTTAWDACGAFIQRCRELGIKVGIDGFGSVGIPLTRLTSMPIDFIKIDRQLTAEMSERRSITPAIQIALATARQFGWKIVAEGVQSDLQRRRLTEAGADCIQGFLIGYPMTAVDFESWREAAAAPV